MSVKSIFEFRFSDATIQEGLPLAISIGNDMPALDGYISHEVIRDVADPNHLMVNTHWNTKEQAGAVLGSYNNDPKIKRAEELLEKKGPNGFIGEIL